MDVPTVGRVSVLADPQGAVFGLYRPEQSGPDGDPLVLGDFSWHDLATDDWKSAWEFYRAIFGWEYESQMDMGPAGIYWMFRRSGGSRALGGMFNRPPEIPVPCWVPYVHVKSADRAAELAMVSGGRVVWGPMDVPGGGRIAQIVDPQGGAFAVHSAVLQPVVKPAPKRPARKQPVAKAPAKQPPARKPAVKKVGKPKGRPVKKAAAKKAARRK
jgi:predicted enzyme related to lactoylglutathione lyase